jgi:HPt (histidine-containing phosphotransfer) domain-containing protein
MHLDSAAIVVTERIPIEVEAELKPLMPRFLANRHKDLEIIERGLAAQDFERVRRTGHSMRGVGAGYGFERISELGTAIEMAAKRRDSAQLLALIEEYRDFLSAVDVVFV